MRLIVRLTVIGLALVGVGCGGGGNGGGGGGGPATPANQPPTANAGADLVAAGDTPVTLNGIASSDPDQDALTYQWTQASGTSVALDDPTVAQPGFRAPDVTASETLTFNLVVSDGTTQSVADTVTVTVHPPTRVSFDSSASGVVPSNFGFTGSTDRTLNIPGYDDVLNRLDGYSTTTAARIDFDGKLDPASIVAGENVRVFEVTIDSDTREVLSIVTELEAGVDYIAEISNLPEMVGGTVPAERRVLIKPLLPFQASTGTGDATGYLVVATNGLRDQNGLAVQTTDTYEAVRGNTPLTGSDASLEELRQQTVQWTQLLAGYNATPALDLADIVVSFSFTTQTTVDALLSVAAAATGRPLSGIQPNAGYTNDSTEVDVYEGTIQVPGYRGPGDLLWTNASGGRVNRYDPVPVQKSVTNLDFYAALPRAPDCPRPAQGWPVVIVVPGGSGGGTDHLSLLAPFSGTSPHSIGTIADELGERCVASISTQRIPLTGATVLETTDALRQSVADTVELVHTLPTMDLDNDTLADFDANAIGYIGVSSGASQGLVLMAVEPMVRYATIASPDVGMAKSLDGSPVRAPAFENTLANNFGALKGSPEYESIVGIVQTAYDSFDPLNYLHLIDDDQAVHLIEVYGGGVLPGDLGAGAGFSYPDGQGNFLNPGDLTTPPEVLNTGYFGHVNQVVETAPLAGIEAAARVLGLSAATSTIDNRSGGTPVQAIVRFTRGHHSSGYLEVLNGFGTIGVSTEWRNQHNEFMASGGLYLPVDTSAAAAVLQSDPSAGN